MRLSRQRAALVVALLAGSASAAVDRAECLRTRADDLASLASCGHSGSIRYCLTQLMPARSRQCTAAALERCFVNAGCTADEARVEAELTLKRCDDEARPDSADMGDLRRRQLTDDGEDPFSTPANKPTKAAPGRQTAQQQQPAETPTPDQADQTPAVTDTPQSTEVEIVTVTPTPASSFHATSTPLVCYTTTTVSTTTCPVQSTGPQSGKQTLPCFPTLVSFPTCAAGLLCRTDAQGNPVCMRLDNTFTTTGIIISLVFAVAVTAAVAAICFFCCRERRVQSRLRKAAEAAAIAKQAALDKKRPTVGVRSVSAQSVASDAQPLMPHQGQSIVYPEQDPFSDRHQMR